MLEVFHSRVNCHRQKTVAVVQLVQVYCCLEGLIYFLKSWTQINIVSIKDAQDVEKGFLTVLVQGVVVKVLGKVLGVDIAPIDAV